MSNHRVIKFDYICRDIRFDEICHVYLTLDEIWAHSFPTWIVSSSCKIIAKRQFTGLLDKNGVEIFEGDIVAWMTDYRLKEPDCKMAVTIDTADGVTRSYPAINSSSEIIGNIYESPELLEKKPM